MDTPDPSYGPVAREGRTGALQLRPKEKAIVAIAKATSDAYPDPKDKSVKLVVGDMTPKRRSPDR